MQWVRILAITIFSVWPAEAILAGQRFDIGCEHWLKEVPQTVRRGLVAETSEANTLIIAYAQGNYSKTLLEITAGLEEKSKLIIVVFDSIDEKADAVILRKLAEKPNVTTIRVRNYYGSPWTRDWVPQKVIRKDGRVEYVNLRYYAVDNADLSPSYFAAAFDLPHYQSWIRGELGNIMTDGKGRLFTTNKLIYDNVTSRPREGITKEMLVRELKSAFEADEIHFIPQHPRDGRVGHVDLVAKYVGRINDQEIMLVSESVQPQVKPVLDRAAAQFKDLGFQVVPVDAYEAITHKGAVHCLTCSVDLKNANETKSFRRDDYHD